METGHPGMGMPAQPLAACGKAKNLAVDADGDDLRKRGHRTTAAKPRVQP